MGANAVVRLLAAGPVSDDNMKYSCNGLDCKRQQRKKKKCML